jgi:hypothetical protein
VQGVGDPGEEWVTQARSFITPWDRKVSNYLGPPNVNEVCAVLKCAGRASAGWWEHFLTTPLYPVGHKISEQEIMRLSRLAMNRVSSLNKLLQISHQ